MPAVHKQELKKHLEAIWQSGGAGKEALRDEFIRDSPKLVRTIEGSVAEDPTLTPMYQEILDGTPLYESGSRNSDGNIDLDVPSGKVWLIKKIVFVGNSNCTACTLYVDGNDIYPPLTGTQLTDGITIDCETQYGRRLRATSRVRASVSTTATVTLRVYGTAPDKQY